MFTGEKTYAGLIGAAVNISDSGELTASLAIAWRDSDMKGDSDMDIQQKTIIEFGGQILENQESGHRILCLCVIGEIEGHEELTERSKTTKYEHLLPLLVQAQEDKGIDGILLLINTIGGDCSCGLALAETIASVTKPVASLIIGDSHSIGVPVSVAADRTFIAPTATMIIHPVRLNGTVIGAPQTFDYFRLIQDRILDFTAAHSLATKESLEEMMMRKGIMAKDIGTILVGGEAVEVGLADEVGGIDAALSWLHKKCGIKK